MSKHKDSLQTHHLYLGAGGMLAVAALVVALTFGLSSAQTTCPSGQWWDTMTNTCKSSTTVDPAAACTTAGGTYNAANNPPCTMPASQTCPSGQWWDTASHTCKSTSAGTCAPPAYLDPATSTCKTATTPTVGSCTTGQYWDAASSTCKTSTTGTDPQADCTRANGMWKPVDATHASPWCDMGSTRGSACPTGQYWDNAMNVCKTATPTVGSCTAPAVWDAATSTCKPPTTTGTCPTGQYWDTATSLCKTSTGGACPNGQHWEAGACVADQTFRTCNQGEFPTTSNPCRPADSGAACPSDQYRDSTGTCKPMSEKPPYDMPPPPPEWVPGQCAPDQQKCPDRFDTSRTVCKPKQLSWDPKTRQPVDPPRPATCADFAPPEMSEGDRGFRPPFGLPFGPPRGDPGFGFGERRGEEGSEGPTPCESNPNDPFCQFGFDFNKFSDEHSFDESMFDPTQFKLSNVKQELRNLKREAKEWKRDAKQARQQLKEISRESSGFACPAAAEVDAIAAELESVASQVEALTEASGEEEIQRGLALREHVNGRYDNETGEQTPGARSKLFGGPPDPETGEPTPGKIQGLNVCRELSGVIFGACQAYKDISREFENIKENAPAEAVAVFEEVLPELKSRCENPLGVLAEKGLSLDVLSEPFYPDPEVCSFGGFGPGPFPMGGGPGPFPGGDFQGGDFGQMGGQFGDMPPEMMEMMMEKMKEFESSGGFPGFGGFSGGHRGSGDDSYPDPGARFRGRDFESSVLMAPSHPFDDDFEGDEDFGDDEGFGPPFGPSEVPDECKPPVMRYLGMDEIFRKLDAVRPLMAAHFESMNACKMFEMGKKMSDRESVRGGKFGGPPPEVQDLMELGLQACEAGDTELVDKIREKMMRFGRRGGGLRNMVDIDALVRDKFKEKLKFEDLLGDEEDSEDSEVVRRLTKEVNNLRSQLEQLTKDLSEAQLAVLALKDQVSTLSTKLANSGIADKDTLAAITNFGSLSDDEKTSTTLARVQEVVELAGDVKGVLEEASLSAAEEKKVLAAYDATIKSLVAAPPTDNIVTDIKDSLVALQSYATSGADKKEIADKAIEEFSSIAAANVLDVSAKVAEGTCASGDTCNFKEWYAAPALEAKTQGFIAAELTDIKPGEPETRCAAVTRVARLMEKAGELEIDLKDKSPEKPVEGAPDWCLPFIGALQEENVPFVENLTDPNTPIERGEVALLIHQALGDKLPDPPDAAEFLTPDTQNLSAEEKAAIAEARFNGFFDTVDGKNFAPDQIFNRAQNSLVTVKAREAVTAAAEAKE